MFTREGKAVTIQRENGLRAAVFGPVDEPQTRRRWPIVFAIVVVLGLLSIIGIPLLQEQISANSDNHRVTFVIKARGYNDQATAIPVHVEGTKSDGKAYDKMVYLDGGGNGVVLEPGEYSLSFPGGSLLENGTVLLAPADWQLQVHVPTGLARNEFVQVPIDQVTTYTAVAPIDLTEETLNSVYELAAKAPGDRGKASNLRTVAWQTHENAIAEKTADTAAMEEKAKGDLTIAEGDAAQFMGTLEINTAEEVGERLEDENIQWNLYGRTLAVLWLDEPRHVNYETTVEGYNGYYDDQGNWVERNNYLDTQEYDVTCLVLNNDVEGIYTYNGGDDGTMAAHEGKHVLASGKIDTVDDWSTSQVSPLTLVNPTLEDL